MPTKTGHWWAGWRTADEPYMGVTLVWRLR